MKKYVLSLLSASLLFTLCISPNVEAKDFKGQEEKYIKLCSSKTMTRSTYKTCKEFNKYLKDKNASLSKEIKDTKSDIADTKGNLENVSKKIDALASKIKTKENEIKYLETSITKLENDIVDKNNTIRDRMYTMQSYTNTNMYIDFLFGAKDFSDFFARVQSIDEITAYDKELMQELKADKNELKQQRTTVITAKSNLENQKKQQVTLQKEYEKEIDKLTAQLASDQNKKNSLNANKQTVSKALEASLKEFIKEASKPSEKGKVIKGTSSGKIIKGSTGNSATGAAIASKAMSRIGCPYVWGATGPNSFDCSGLVSWAFAAAGKSIGRATSHGLATMGQSVSKGALQAGDVVVFSSNGSLSGVHHVGIYIGGGKMVHAPCTGQRVKVQTITSGYYARQYYSGRRIY